VAADEAPRGAPNDELLRDYAERVAALLNGAGFPRMPARVLMALTVSETGLTAAELAERLDVSAGAISGAVRYLQTVTMVHRVSQPRSRQGVYELHHAWYSASMAQTRIYDAMISISADVVELAGGPDSAVGGRLDELVSFYRFLRRRVPELLTEWDEQRKRERQT
jgi:predicted transcriptional regulator